MKKPKASKQPELAASAANPSEAMSTKTHSHPAHEAHTPAADHGDAESKIQTFLARRDLAGGEVHLHHVDAATAEERRVEKIPVKDFGFAAVLKTHGPGKYKIMVIDAAGQRHLPPGREFVLAGGRHHAQSEKS